MNIPRFVLNQEWLRVLEMQLPLVGEIHTTKITHANRNEVMMPSF